jgi:hypothetical protein
MTDQQHAPREVALDACVLINIAASGIGLGRLGELAGVRFLATHVVAREVHYLLPMESDGEREVIHLDRLIADGEISKVDLTPDEVASFVDLARSLDDGEASSIAIAAARGWTVASDDRKARRTASEWGVELLSTADLVKGWADALPADREQLLDALARIHTRARFVPAQDDPLVGWWRAAVAG